MAMAGDLAAHAVWGVSDGEMLIPIVGILNADGKTSMQRLITDTSAEAMVMGDHALTHPQQGSIGVTFIRDGIITLDSGRTDALIIDISFTEDPSRRLQILVPYRNAKHADGFAVHRPQITRLDGIAEEAVDGLVAAFFDGIDAHQQGSAIWKSNYVDQPGDSALSSGEENTAFSPEEFASLKLSPFLVFFIVAAADGKVDKNEINAFARILMEAGKLGNALFNRIVTNVIDEVPRLLQEASSQGLNFLEELGRIRGLLEERLCAEDASAYKKTLMQLGREIAEASGGFLGIGNKVSKEEKAALALLSICLDVPLEEQG